MAEKQAAPTKPKPRRYDSSRRSRQAEQTRREVLMAALDLFNERGWSGTTLAAIAERAGVAVETIYSGFGSKKGLLRATVDVGVVGDTEPVPFAEREEAARMTRGSREARLRAATEIQTDIHERLAGVWQAVVAAASSDEEVDGWRKELDDGRRIDTRRFLALIYEREIDEHVVDLIWALFSSEVYWKLTRDVGWSRSEYETWLYTAMERVVD
ncbi:MAG TPA: helix-turn-helix domain-containing protein [Acidimicrobiia bacterium]|nr:helix-turn-helix domain-containing protein [Acidimicrobiia bacterium]